MKPKSVRANVERFESRAGRTIDVSGVRWKYVIGRSKIVAYSETGERRLKACWLVRGSHSPYIFERGQYKRTGDGAIGPSHVANWLKQN